MVHFYKFNRQGFISFDFTVSRAIKPFFVSCMCSVLHVYIFLVEFKILNLCNKIFLRKDLCHLLVDCFFKQPNINILSGLKHHLLFHFGLFEFPVSSFLINLSWKILSCWEINFWIYLFCDLLFRSTGDTERGRRPQRRQPAGFSTKSLFFTIAITGIAVVLGSLLFQSKHEDSTMH